MGNWLTLKRRVFAIGAKWAKAAESSVEHWLVESTFDGHGARDVAAIPSWTTRKELHALFRLAREMPSGSNALEIGSYYGASSCHIAAGFLDKRSRLICVDTWNNETMPEGTSDTYQQFLANTRAFSNLIIPVRKRSEDLVENDISLPISLIFIDGDHDYLAVSKDFEITSKWLAPGGVVAFHDVGIRDYPGVGKLAGSLLASQEWRLEGMVESLAWFRRVRIEPGQTQA